MILNIPDVIKKRDKRSLCLRRLRELYEESKIQRSGKGRDTIALWINLFGNIGGLIKLAGDNGFTEFIAEWNGNMIRGNERVEIKLR